MDKYIVLINGSEIANINGRTVFTLSAAANVADLYRAEEGYENASFTLFKKLGTI